MSVPDRIVHGDTIITGNGRFVIRNIDGHSGIDVDRTDI